MCVPLEEGPESKGKSKCASVEASAIILGFLCACNVPGPGMACPALSGAHRLGEGARPNNEVSVWGAMGRDPQAGESSIPGPVPQSHAHQVHRVMAWRVPGTALRVGRA